jgi:hypothetical protein
MAAEFEAHLSALGPLSAESRADVVTGLQRALRRWSRFVSTGVMSADSDFDPLREWTRARAAEGVRLEDLLRSFGLAHQTGWRLLRRHAHRDESDVLLELAAPLARYVDEISAVVTQTYLAERELLVSEEERRTRNLLERLCLDAPLSLAEAELAEHLEVPLNRAYVPFLAEHARRAGLLGRLNVEDHLLEILLERSPRLAARLRTRVLGPLAEVDPSLLSDDHRRTVNMAVAVGDVSARAMTDSCLRRREGWISGAADSGGLR